MRDAESVDHLQSKSRYLGSAWVFGNNGPRKSKVMQKWWVFAIKWGLGWISRTPVYWRVEDDGVNLASGRGRFFSEF